MDDQLRIEFNEWARAGRGEGMEKGHRPVGEQAIERMQLPRDARILDVGCGSGWATRLMAERAVSGRVVGIDIADEMVQPAENSSRAFQNIEFEVATAESLPFKDSEFTHAFSMESLYYYSNMIAALREIHRVLEHGGVFVTNRSVSRERTFASVDPNSESTGPFARHPRLSIDVRRGWVCKRSGWTVVRSHSRSRKLFRRLIQNT